MVQVQGLTHRFDNGVLGLAAVDLNVGTGEYLVLAGQNGAGKTLLMRHLVGLVKPTSGSIFFQGKDIFGHLSVVRKAIGLVFQDSGAQIVGLTVGEEVAFGPRNLGWSREKIELIVNQSLTAVGLLDRLEQPCGQLSGGEKRRLAIAGVLAMDPQILVLDEPFTGLDLFSVQAVLTTLNSLHAQGKTIVLLTHELDKCLAHASRLVLMDKGRIIADATPAQLWQQILAAGIHRPLGPVSRLKTMTWLA